MMVSLRFCFFIPIAGFKVRNLFVWSQVKEAARGSLLLSDRYFAVIHGISKWRCYLYMPMLHVILSVHPLPCTSLSPIWFFTWQQWKKKLGKVWVMWPFSYEVVMLTKLPRVNGWTQAPNQIQVGTEWKECVMDLVIIHLMLLTTEVKHFKRSAKINTPNRSALLFLCTFLLPSLPSWCLLFFHFFPFFSLFKLFFLLPCSSSLSPCHVLSPERLGRQSVGQE